MPENQAGKTRKLDNDCLHGEAERRAKLRTSVLYTLCNCCRDAKRLGRLDNGQAKLVSWGDGQKPDRAEMIEAAQSFLKATLIF